MLDLVVVTRSELSVFDFEGHLTFHSSFPASSLTSVTTSQGVVFVSILSGNELTQLSSNEWRSPKEKKANGFSQIFAVSAGAGNAHIVGSSGEKVVIGSSSSDEKKDMELTLAQLEGNKAHLFTATHFVLADSKSVVFSPLPGSNGKRSSFDLPSLPSLQSSTEIKHLVGPLVAVNGVIFSSNGKIKIPSPKSDKSDKPAIDIASNDAISTYCPSAAKCFIHMAGENRIQTLAVSEHFELSALAVHSIPTKTKVQISREALGLTSFEGDKSLNKIRLSLGVVIESSKSSSSGETVVDVLYLLQRADWSLESGRVGRKTNEKYWDREEALSASSATLVVELPAQVHDALLNEGISSVEHFVRRVQGHVQEISDFFPKIVRMVTDGDVLPKVWQLLVSGDMSGAWSVVRMGMSSTERQYASVKDDFGFAKLLIAATDASTLVCYQSLTRELMWTSALPSTRSLPISVTEMKVIQADSPQGPIIALFGKFGKSNDPNAPKSNFEGRTFSLKAEALTGKLFDFFAYPFAHTSIVTLNTEQERISSTSKQQSEAEVAVPMFFVDEKQKLWLDASNGDSGLSLKKQNLRFYLAQQQTGVITGFEMKVPEKVGVEREAAKRNVDMTRPVEVKGLIAIETQETWQIQLGSAIDALVQNEVRTKSPGKVVGADRSVLPKYLNPNAIAVATTLQSSSSGDSESKGATKTSNLHVTVIDTVTGNIIHRLVQRNAVGRPDSDLQASNSQGAASSLPKQSHPMRMKMVFNDDWVVFSYWSTRANRFEIMSVELFEAEANFKSTQPQPEIDVEGQKKGGNKASLAFATQPKLDVRVQTFILMGAIRAMATTKAHLGISVQDVLLVYQDGKTSQISIKYLDPRRPLNQEDDPTLRQYYAYIPIDGQTVINYHQTIARVEHVKTSPSALESSSIVWLVGLDSFVRLVASQSFDRLSHDYSFLQIGTICVALGLTTYVLRIITKQREVNDKWK